MKKVKKIEFSPELKDFWYCYSRLLLFFKGDKDKVYSWWITENPNFGGLSAQALFERKRRKVVRSFIEANIED